MNATRWAKMTVAAALVVAAAAGSATAATCQQDFQRLASVRQTYILKLNALSKRGHGKLDPVAACGILRNLSAAEITLLKYMTDNKDFCGVPDQAISNLSTGHAKTVSFAGKACSVAAKAAQMRKRAAQGGGGLGAPRAPALPAGPL
ncbi:MAG: hypothetical protein KGI57_01000 [Hyphomicrobiales bacterium]|nr:hypothetical protein [Hyphomicrobiales bacterium]